MPAPVVVSLSSQVVYGHVGNCATVPALQALGCDVLAIPTVLLAHHPGHGPPKGRVLPAGEVADLLAGIDDAGALRSAGALLTGYLGLADTAAVAVDAVQRLRRHVPGALYLCDPVIGDNGRVYVRDGVEQAIRERLLPLADVLTPNHFEFERLAGATITTLDQAIDAARGLLRRGPKIVVVTTLQHAAVAPDQLDTLAVTADAAWTATCPRLPAVPNGSGDLLAALLLGRLLLGASLPDALAHAASAVQQVLVASVGALEMRLVACRHHLRRPPPLQLRRVSTFPGAVGRCA